MSVVVCGERQIKCPYRSESGFCKKTIVTSIDGLCETIWVNGQVKSPQLIMEEFEYDNRRDMCGTEDQTELSKESL